MNILFIENIQNYLIGSKLKSLGCPTLLVTTGKLSTLRLNNFNLNNRNNILMISITSAHHFIFNIIDIVHYIRNMISFFTRPFIDINSACLQKMINISSFQIFKTLYKLKKKKLWKLLSKHYITIAVT